MTAAIGAGLDFFRQVLALRAYRQEVLSADIANASTPGFKAVDLDFAGALDAATARRLPLAAPNPGRRAWLVDDARQMKPAGAASGQAAPPAAAFVKYQTGAEVTLDGNSVDLDHEKVTAAENAVQYQAAATFATQTIKLLLTAINGASGSQQSSGS
ncbi:MAG TPA: flagellar basal body rod protein FlgB [Stellaceae bacterium]|nr:flagellar basal body rod protein FlgB [Stellaceae bacterium]